MTAANLSSELVPEPQLSQGLLTSRAVQRMVAIFATVVSAVHRRDTAGTLPITALLGANLLMEHVILIPLRHLEERADQILEEQSVQTINAAAWLGIAATLQITVLIQAIACWGTVDVTLILPQPDSRQPMFLGL